MECAIISEVVSIGDTLVYSRVAMMVVLYSIVVAHKPVYHYLLSVLLLINSIPF